jgi:hypothetical protein
MPSPRGPRQSSRPQPSAVAKVRGTQLGGWRVSVERCAEIQAGARQARSERVAKQRAELSTIINQIRTSGCKSLLTIAVRLNIREIEAPRGRQWGTVQVQCVLLKWVSQRVRSPLCAALYRPNRR